MVPPVEAFVEGDADTVLGWDERLLGVAIEPVGVLDELLAFTDPEDGRLGSVGVTDAEVAGAVGVDVAAGGDESIDWSCTPEPPGLHAANANPLMSANAVSRNFGVLRRFVMIAPSFSAVLVGGGCGAGCEVCLRN